jgi:hypothetical protein
MEIEVSGGMIVAGSDVVGERWIELTSSAGLSTVPALVEAVYRAMERQRRLTPDIRASRVIEGDC